MTAAGWATIAGALIALTGVGVGLLVDQRAAGAERRTRVFAEAMRAARDYREFPYLVWRRANNDMTTVEALGKTQSATLSNLRFHLNWLELEDPHVATAYRLLYQRMKQSVPDNRRAAWREPLLSDKRRLDRNPEHFSRSEDQVEVHLCRELMKANLHQGKRSQRRALLAELARVDEAHRRNGWETRGRGQS